MRVPFLVATLLIAGCTPAPSSTRVAQAPSLLSTYVYPATPKQDVTDSLFGTTIHDPYRWLETKSPAVDAWVRAQDEFARATLGKLEGRDMFRARLKELFYVESVGLPRKYGARLFYERRDRGSEKSRVFVRTANASDLAAGPDEKVLLDPLAWSPDGTVSLGSWTVSPDGNLVAYKARPKNSDEAVLHVLDVATGKESEHDVIEGAKYGSVAWTPKCDGFYYIYLPRGQHIPIAERPGYAEMRYHALGHDPATDRTVHDRTGDPKSFLDVSISHDGKFLFAIVQHGWSRTDLYWQDLNARMQRWKPIVVGKDANFSVEAYKGDFFVTTNWNAPNSRVLHAYPGEEPSRWREVVPERKDAPLHDASIVGGTLALSYLKDASSHVEFADLAGKSLRVLPIPTIGTVRLSGREEEDSVYYSFASYTHPTETFEISASKGTARSLHRAQVPADMASLEVERIFAKSKDGTRVPAFMIHKRGFVRDGSAPTILYGYGGFQVAQQPQFISSLIPWVEAGGVYVFSVLRGGSEFGEAWHRDGMGHQKQNVFDDFISVAELLIAFRVTSPTHLVVRGASNGGLLVGAAVTQRPDLFRAGLCGVPLLDMVRYHLFGSGKTWIEEYGSSDTEQDFRALHAYSPYHHVEPGKAYPALLLLSADADDRVDPMHARKFTALMQERSKGGLVLLRIERNAGHGGADLVRASVEKVVDEYAFAMHSATHAR